MTARSDGPRVVAAPTAEGRSLATSDSVMPGHARHGFPIRAWLVILTLHVGLGAYDALHPDAFLRADRAESRWVDVRDASDAMRSGRLEGLLIARGNPGDYIVQAVLFSIGGRSGIIAVQALLMLLAGFAVFRLALMLGLPWVDARTAMVVSLALPHAVILPHQLSSEALEAPLLALSVACLAASSAGRPLAFAACAGALTGVAALVRPVTLMWPPLAAALLAGRTRRNRIATYLALSYLPAALWWADVASHTGTIGMGASRANLGHNLYDRVELMIETLPAAGSVDARRRFLEPQHEHTLALGDYARFAAAQPQAFAAHSLRDAAVFVAKSGVERIFVDYLGWNPAARAGLQDPRRGWRQQLAARGPRETLSYLWRTQGAVLPISLVGALAMLALSALAVFGAWRHRRWLGADAPAGRPAFALVVALPLYALLCSQVADAVQSRHRAPVEFAIVLLAVAGARSLQTRAAA